MYYQAGIEEGRRLERWEIAAENCNTILNEMDDDMIDLLEEEDDVLYSDEEEPEIMDRGLSLYERAGGRPW